jgi:hypothetical protein
LRNCGRNRHQRQHEDWHLDAFLPSIAHLASVLQQGRKSANIHTSSGVIWGIPLHNNPYWGGGLLCLSWLPESVLRVEDSPVDVNAMNKWENLIADTPTFGCWCSDGDKLVFAQFLPNIVKGLPTFTDLIILWPVEKQSATEN